MTLVGCVRVNHAEYIELKFTEASEEAIDAFFEHFKDVMHEANTQDTDQPARVLINTNNIDDTQQPVGYLVKAIRREAKNLHTTHCIYVSATIKYQVMLHTINAILPMLAMKNYRYKFFANNDEAMAWLIEQTSLTCK